MLMTVNRASDNFFVRDIRKIEAGTAIERIHFLDDTAVFVLGNGDILLEPESGESRRLSLFEGALLSSDACRTAVVAGGDDGNVVRLTSDGEQKIIAADEKRRWIDHVAIDDDGAVAWSAAKDVVLREPDGSIKSVELQSTVGGLALSVRHLGIAHYGGVTLLPRDGDGAQNTLAFEGMHTGISFHPDHDFVVTRMRDPVLHGWCLRESGEHAMEGYAGPVRSISWSAQGHWLASSGARYLALWPIRQPRNPISNVPFLLAGYRAMSTAVACHPKQNVVAVGYADGAVLMIRIEDEAEILLKNPAGSPVSALTWGETGAELAIGCVDGTGRVIYFS